MSFLIELILEFVVAMVLYFSLEFIITRPLSLREKFHTKFMKNIKDSTRKAIGVIIWIFIYFTFSIILSEFTNFDKVEIMYDGLKGGFFVFGLLIVYNKE